MKLPLTFTLGVWIAITSPALGPSALAADPFAENIRTTPWRSPLDEQKALQVPEGFALQLVASEPDINKPLNLAFDTLGRLWVTTSIEYPVAVATNQVGRDRLMILEDFGPDGRARKRTQFAGGLNIPIGVYPFQSPDSQGRPTWKAVVWSIPHIWLLEDTDGDGQADRRQVLYAGFDSSRDTHGNQASFRRGFDGWLYCTHGYNNDSHVKGADGHEVHLNSGNTYRIRLDGSRIEHYTHGQVNPFGLAFDPSGSLFASDCHSEPMYQLLAGGYYPSFGKPHDGLGFVPKMMESKRGSTAIDGLSLYADTLWPTDFWGNVFIGDVMTGRVYRDTLVERGSTRIAQALPDLVRAEDPWFRPVDTQLGPDGALYIADFYNRIIGHYEVPLGHPGRDRTSGRIWRVVPTAAPLRPPALLLGLAGALAELSSPNLTRRMLAMNALADVHGSNAVAALRALIAQKGVSSLAGAHALWLLQRQGALVESELKRALQHPDRLVRTHAQRILADRIPWTANHRAAAVRGLSDPDLLVRRCAAEALAGHPDMGNIQPLIRLVEGAPAEDTHLRYVARKSLRDQLSLDTVLQEALAAKPSTAHAALLAELCLSVKSDAAAAFLLERLRDPRTAPREDSVRLDHVRHIARYVSESRLAELATLARAEADSPGSLGRKLQTFRALEQGLQQRGAALPATLRSWGSELVSSYFRGTVAEPGWLSLPYDAEPTANPWGFELLQGVDGRERRMLSSRPYGEDLTGVLRSRPFPLPDRLEFWMAGQDGYREAPPLRLSRVRLCAAGSGKVLQEAFAPQSGTARRVGWEFSPNPGGTCYLELIDGNDSADLAWIAVGGFAPELAELQLPVTAPRQEVDDATAAAGIAVQVNEGAVAPTLSALCVPRPDGSLRHSDPDLAEGLVRAWLALDSGRALPRLVSVLTAEEGPGFYRERLASVLISQGTPEVGSAILKTMRGLSQRAQERLSYPLASHPAGAEWLLSGMESGAVSPRVLQRVGVGNRLRISRPRDWEARVTRLKAQFPAEDDVRDRRIAEYKAAGGAGGGDKGKGRQVFSKHCAVCHRIGTEGGLVGPQLDGIGQRGLDRLCEDILDPNRAVDRSFRVTLLTLKDQEVLTGLLRREEGETVVLADATGKELRIPKESIAERRESETSLMPDNFGEAISPSDFSDLLAFLLSTALSAQR